ncbi:hypothetical protein MJO52_09545 [Microbulbifer variabilis]|uniref:Uncharacterized protein n=1 Tax=Microbulbifer variabilis TaxID=266805 RepID=A0ABY4VH89_9GAMM|nr:hypothetical protein [Microbulbifer variabilis]USD23360.1 hypothetical protein MJO52_09545 [Microbulbifer variabilis]
MGQTNKKNLYYVLGAFVGVILFILSFYGKQYVLIFYSVVTVGFLSVVGVRVSKPLVVNLILVLFSSNVVAWLLTIIYWGS